MTTLLPWQIEEIEAYAAKGKSGAWIAGKMELLAATVNYRMLRAGYDPWPGRCSNKNNHPGAFSADEDARMLELAKTLPIYKVAKAMDRAITSVRIRLMTLEVRAEKALEGAR